MKMRALATAAAASALTFAVAGPAFAGGETGGQHGLTVSPSHAGPGTTVEVSANCKDGGHGTVASDAFETSQAHTDRHHAQGGGHDKKGHHKKPFASAKVMHEGLTNGKTYQVTGYCKDHKPLTGTFTYNGVGGGAHAGLGGLASGEQGGMSTATTAAAATGGLALAGAAGYLMIWRRRANADQS
ncbi:hypothetical protein JGS22_007610 [Streptomyces sp. P38-E01]|uniref:Uncharacterized protein n=1 Tax=Streptomyces tardus TaxID=2780544 RepID=A0A949JEH7_9ACTN|nr:hypothetical protein [Streptomyces tardus]MBU7597493.1 hypothetical protein [Streptomyces tardus]